jgi:hypothetical protein
VPFKHCPDWSPLRLAPCSEEGIPQRVPCLPPLTHTVEAERRSVIDNTATARAFSVLNDAFTGCTVQRRPLNSTLLPLERTHS